MTCGGVFVLAAAIHCEVESLVFNIYMPFSRPRAPRMQLCNCAADAAELSLPKMGLVVGVGGRGWYSSSWAVRLLLQYVLHLPRAKAFFCATSWL